MFIRVHIQTNCVRACVCLCVLVKRGFCTTANLFSPAHACANIRHTHRLIGVTVYLLHFVCPVSSLCARTHARTHAHVVMTSSRPLSILFYFIFFNFNIFVLFLDFLPPSLSLTPALLLHPSTPSSLPPSLSRTSPIVRPSPPLSLSHPLSRPSLSLSDNQSALLPPYIAHSRCHRQQGLDSISAGQLLFSSIFFLNIFFLFHFSPTCTTGPHDCRPTLNCLTSFFSNVFILVFPDMWDWTVLVRANFVITTSVLITRDLLFAGGPQIVFY